MRQFFTIALGASASCLLLFACNRTESMEELSMKMADSMCGKMETCKDEMMAGIPEGMRAQVQAQMPTKDSCLQNAKKARDEEKARGKKDVELTADEVKVFKSCMETLVAAPCKDMMSGAMFRAGACQEMNEISKKKYAEQK